jgi:ATP-dependent DNA helicase RecG
VSQSLDAPLQFVKGVGPRRVVEFHTAGLFFLEDLLLRLPIRYEDRSCLLAIANLHPGEVASVSGEVLSCGVRSSRRRRFQVFEMLVGDSSGQVRAVFFNQRFLSDVFVPHQSVVLFGKVERSRFGGGLQFQNPDYEIVTGEGSSSDQPGIHTGRIVPVYERLGTVTSKMLRRIVHAALKEVPLDVEDPIPDEVRHEYKLVDRCSALNQVHFPRSGDSIDDLNRFASLAQRRLIFEEFFFFQLGLAVQRRNADTVLKPHKIEVNNRIRRAALSVLPFRLTKDQRLALKEIVVDMQKTRPMNRLLQGDVGSGKTIVALLGALVAMENGLQVAMMSPTELLAEQHFLNVSNLLRDSRFKAVLVTGTMNAKVRRKSWHDLSSGEGHLAVGTHALVQEPVRFTKLGMVIIDEQHRFGVIQRAILRKKGLRPDVLVMTATPIPRTLSLTTYGDLDASLIHELPPGRQPVATRLVPEGDRLKVYRLIRNELRKGRQGYIVYPLVEESEKLSLRAATEMAASLKESTFSEFQVGLVHGRMRSDERETVMSSFVEGDIDLLVATTVIEVGVDVPNASVMLIENAERFGLAQLHQLRGRVGRGPYESYCLLLYQDGFSEAARSRLDAVVSTTDGFEIAERDLEIRGPGDFFGTRQSGVPNLRVGDLTRDYGLMEEARQAAVGWLDMSTASKGLIARMLKGWSKRFGLVDVG